MKDNVIFRENCMKQNTNLYTINSTGILKVNANCEIIVNGMKITNRNTRTSYFSAKPLFKTFSKISINNLTSIENKINKLSQSETTFLNFNEGYEKLIQKSEADIEKIQKLKEIDHLENKVLSKTIIFWIIVIIITLISKRLWKKYC